MRGVQPFVFLALKICEDLEIVDKKGQAMVMKFCKMYSGDKILKILEKCRGYSWHERNPLAAFMKAVGEVNREA